MPGGVDAKDTSLYIGFTSARTGSGKFSGIEIRSRNRTRVVATLFGHGLPWVTHSSGRTPSQALPCAAAPPVEPIPDSARDHRDDIHSSSICGNRKRRQQNRRRDCLAPFTPPDRRQQTERAGESDFLGKSVMEVCVQLKICEGCGCLWYRAQALGTVYCSRCKTELEKFPSPESRKRRGRPVTKRFLNIWAVAAETGGAQ